MGNDDDEQNGRCMYNACLCSHTSFDINKIELGCRHSEDFLCIRHNMCLSLNARSLGLGVTTNKDDDQEIFKLGLGFCDIGLIKPSSLCASAGAFLCCYEASSFPCSEDYVDKCVLAWCFIQCAPDIGCCNPPPECPALKKLLDEVPAAESMDRGDDSPPPPVEADAEVVAEDIKGEDKEVKA